MKKRFLSIILAICMVIISTPLSVQASNANLSGSGTKEDPYVIESTEALTAFCADVNSGNDYSGKYVVLKTNIALSDVWTPIGNGARSGSSYTGNAFKGTFDGGEHSISGLTINAAEADAAIGLFGVVDGGTVKNLTLSDVSIEASSNKNAGAAIGLMVNNSTADNITVSGSVSAADGVGGVVGRMTISGTISNCKNSAVVSGAAAGGIIGKAYYTGTGVEMNITGCTNSGTITGTASGGAGGIVGFSAANVMNCTNTGNITASADGSNVGGIVGWQQMYGEISGNTNSANISTDFKATTVGGIVGWVNYQYKTDGTAAEYPRYEIIAVTGNNNKGTISAANSTLGSGGIVGGIYNAAAVHDNKNSASSISGSVFAGGIVGNLQQNTANGYYNSANALIVRNNASSTKLSSISANCVDTYAYNNANTIFIVEGNTDKVCNCTDEGHTLVVVPPVDATCQAAGTKEYWVCSCCGKMFADSKGAEAITEIPVAPKLTTHKYQNGACTVCQEQDLNYNTKDNVEMKVDSTTTGAVKNEATTAKNEILSIGNTSDSKIDLGVSDAVIEDVVAKINSNDATLEIITEVVAQTVADEEIKETAQEDVAKIEEMASSNGANVAQYLDLSILVKAVEAKGTKEEKVTTLGELTETKGDITFTISVPEKLRASNITVTVVCVHNNGAVEKLTTTKNGDGTYSFTTKKFSTYAVTYTTNALPEADAEGVITLTENVALADIYLIDDGKDYTIDLNGYTIKGEKTTNFHIINGTLKVIDYSSDSTGAINVSGEAFRVGKKDSAKDTVALIIADGVDVTSSDDACVVIYDGTLTTSGNLTSHGNYATVTGSGSGGDNTVINIEGGIVKNTVDTAIYHPQVGTLTVKDGTIEGTTGIEMRAGTLTVEGGTIKATGTFAEGKNGNGTTVTGAAVAVSQHTTNNAISVTIKGGTLTGAKALYETDLEDEETVGVTMSITDGTFNGAVSSENIKEFVSGGSFQEPVSAEFCAEGFAPNALPDGSFGVHEHTLTAVGKQEASCTETGREAYWCCADTNCGIIYSDAEGQKVTTLDALTIPAAGHKLTAFTKVEPTCTETGTEAYWYCETCQKYYSDAEAKNEIAAPVVIPALGHVGVKHDHVPATCTESGWEGEIRCERCDVLLEANEENQPFGHAYVDGVCVVCGEVAATSVDTPSPATGDTSNTGLWVFIAVLACVSLAGSVVLGKKIGYHK